MRKIDGVEAIQLFKERFLQDVFWTQVDKYPAVKRNIDLLVQELDRATFNCVNPVPEKNDTNSKMKRFIFLFKRAYLESIKLEYDMKIKPEQYVMIEHLITYIEEKKGNIDEYVNWFFNDFHVKNPKFSISIGSIVSEHIRHQYVKENLTKIQKRVEDEVKQVELNDIMNMYRELSRSEYGARPEVRKRLLDSNEQHRTGMLDQKAWKDILIQIMGEKNKGV